MYELCYLEQNVDGNEKKDDQLRARALSATFADLPAPDLEWEQMQSAPVPRLDGFAVQIKNLLYVFAGYGTLDYVNSFPFYLCGSELHSSNSVLKITILILSRMG